MHPNETILQAGAAVDAAIARLLAIKWNSNYLEHKTSKRALVEEYRRRLAFWYMALGRDKTGESFKTFDLPAELLPLPKLAQEKIDAVWEPYAERHFREEPELIFFQYKICKQYLHWTAIEASPEVTKYGLPSPYEPLIMLYERGGYFQYGHDGIELGTLISYHGLSPEQYLHTKVFDINPEALDALDAEPKPAPVE